MSWQISGFWTNGFLFGVTSDIPVAHQRRTRFRQLIRPGIALNMATVWLSLPFLGFIGRFWSNTKHPDLAAHLHLKEKPSPDDISAYITDRLTDKTVRGEGALLRQASTNTETVLFLPSFFDWRDPKGSFDSRVGNAQPTDQHWRQKTEDAAGFNIEEGVWKHYTSVNIHAGSGCCWIWSPRGNTLSIHPLSMSHFFHPSATLSWPLPIFWDHWQKSDCPASWHFLFLLSNLDFHSAVHQPDVASD